MIFITKHFSSSSQYFKSLITLHTHSSPLKFFRSREAIQPATHSRICHFNIQIIQYFIIFVVWLLWWPKFHECHVLIDVRCYTRLYSECHVTVSQYYLKIHNSGWTYQRNETIIKNLLINDLISKGGSGLHNFSRTLKWAIKSRLHFLYIYYIILGNVSLCIWHIPTAPTR